MFTAMSPTLTTSRLAEVRAFYETHLQAKVLFDCGWYVSLQLGTSEATILSLMAPQGGTPEYQGGLTLNLKVPNADAAHTHLVTHQGLTPVMPLEDHPWGDRGFVVLDPLGTRLYCFHDIPMTPEYQAALRTQTAP